MRHTLSAFTEPPNDLSQWYLNFLDYQVETGSAFIDILDELLLKEFGARTAKDDRSLLQLEFETEQDKLLFILRFAE